MKDRIKEIRKSLKLTQEEMSSRLMIKRNTIASYETGRNMPTTAVVALICREFNVSEEWLRTGEGEMFVPKTKSAEIADFVGKLMSADDADFKKQLVSVLARTSYEEWIVLEKVAKRLADEIDSKEK